MIAGESPRPTKTAAPPAIGVNRPPEGHPVGAHSSLTMALPDLLATQAYTAGRGGNRRSVGEAVLRVQGVRLAAPPLVRPRILVESLDVPPRLAVVDTVAALPTSLVGSRSLRPPRHGGHPAGRHPRRGAARPAVIRRTPQSHPPGPGDPPPADGRRHHPDGRNRAPWIGPVTRRGDARTVVGANADDLEDRLAAHRGAGTAGPPWPSRRRVIASRRPAGLPVGQAQDSPADHRGRTPT